MNGLDMSQIPMYFLIFECAVVGLFVLIHFLLGIKRGFFKTTWNFFGQVLLVLALFYGLGFFQLNEFVNESTLRDVVNMIGNVGIDLNLYLDKIIEAGALPLVLALADLGFKISIFFSFYFILKFIFQWIIIGIPWLFIKPMVKNLPKNRLFGGLMGAARGAFSGFILIFPVLVLINTIVGQGVEIEDPQYKAYAEAISTSNEYNFVKVINDAVQYEDKGLADWFFDLAFHSKVNDDEVITWRAELAWIGEGAKAALPYVVGGEQFNPETFTAEELGRFEGFFTAFAKSQLLNSILKPGIKLGIAFAPEFGVELPLTDSEIQTLMARLDATEISLTDDFNEIYLAVSELLQVQSFGQWQALGEDFGAIGNFTEDQQELFKSALSRIASLDLIKVGDIALEVGMYNQAVLDQITWIDSTEAKIDMLDKIRQQISAFNGTFISTTLNELVGILDTVLYAFPGIDLNGDGQADVSLSEFISGIQEITILLNSDPAYHAWFQETLGKVADLSIIEVMLDPIISFGVNMLTNTETGWTEEEMEMLLSIIDTNFEDSADLKRELLWIASVYQKLGELEIAEPLVNEEDMVVVLDNLLSSADGRDLFKSAIDTFLDGQLISSLTTQMSNVLIKKYITEPLELVQPLYKAVDLPDFNFNDEIEVVVNVVFGLYENGLLLQEALAEDVDMISVLLPVLVNFVADDDNMTTVLNSNILYAFIDDSLANLGDFSIPDVAKVSDPDSPYNGWIKKTELSTVLEILGGLIEIMDEEGIDFGQIFGSSNMLTDLFPIIKKYVADPDNRELLLSSDVLYSTVSDMLGTVEGITVPDSALVTDENSPYHGWIAREELSKLLEALVILDLNLPGEGESINLDTITTEALVEVIQLESAILRKMITDQLVSANLFDIPVEAFTNETKEELRQVELNKLAEMLQHLEIEVSLLLSGDGSMDAILDEILVSKLTTIDFKDSFIIKGFITKGITDSLGEPHPLAMDAEYPSLLSEDELDEIFKILGSLDTTGEMSLNELIESFLDVDSITFATVNTMVAAGDSILIRSVISDNMLTVDMIAELDLKDDVYHVHNGVPQYDLISQDELIKLVGALNQLSDDENDAILDVVNNLDINTITINDIELMVSKDSSIIRTLVSEKILEMDDFEVHPDAIVDGEITQIALENLFGALSEGLGQDSNIDALTSIADTISIGNLKAMQSKKSKIVNYMMTNMIVDNIGEAYDREAARSEEDPLLLSDDEFTAIFNSLAVIDPSEEQPIVNVADELTELTIVKIGEIVEQGSHILRARLSFELIDNLGEDKVHPDSIDENEDIYQDDLDALFKALVHVGGEKPVTELSTLADDITISDLRNMNDEQSSMVAYLMTKMILENIGEEYDREEARDMDIDPLVFSNVEFVRIFDALNVLDSEEDDPISTVAGKLTNVNVGEVNDIVGVGSVILRARLSKEIIENLGEEKIYPTTIDENGDIFQSDLEDLFVALIHLGEEKPVTSLGSIATNLTVKEASDMNSEGSLIVRGLVSNMVIENIGADEIRSHAYDSVDLAFPVEERFGLLDENELNRLFAALTALAEDEEDKIIELTNSLTDTDDITIGKISAAMDNQSIIINSLVSKEMIPILTIEDIHPESLEENTTPDPINDVVLEIKREDMADFFVAMLVLGPDLAIGQLATELSDGLNILTIKAMRDEQSKLFEGKISRVIGGSIGESYTIRDAAYFDVDDAVLGKDEFALLDPVEITKLLNAMQVIDADRNTAISNLISEFEPSIVTTSKMIGAIEQDSIIIRTMMSEVIISAVTVDRIVPDAYDVINNPDLTQDELEKFSLSIKAVDPSANDEDPDNDQSMMLFATNLGNDVDQFTLAMLYDLEEIDSLIMRKFISEGIISAVGSNNVREDVYDIVPMEFIKRTQIISLLDTLQIIALANGSVDPLLEPLTDVANNVNAENVTPQLLRDIATADSTIVIRMVTDVIDQTGTAMIPNAALEVHAYPGKDLDKAEFYRLADALVALGIFNLDLGAVDTGAMDLQAIQNAIQEESYIVNRMISRAIIAASLATDESRTDVEDSIYDVQVDEMENLVAAFRHLGIESIDTADSKDPYELVLAAQGIGEEQFDIYIGYEQPYDELTEDLGMTIVKDFLIRMLDDKFPDPFNPSSNISVSNRQELHDLVFVYMNI